MSERIEESDVAYMSKGEEGKSLINTIKLSLWILLTIEYISLNFVILIVKFL